jgi:hypothetical protein
MTIKQTLQRARVLVSRMPNDLRDVRTYIVGLSAKIDRLTDVARGLPAMTAVAIVRAQREERDRDQTYTQQAQYTCCGRIGTIQGGRIVEVQYRQGLVADTRWIAMVPGASFELHNTATCGMRARCE